MRTIDYTTVDKSEWGDGDWKNEPDKKQYQDTETGYPCLIVRNHHGALCGYVGVNDKHPLYGVEYSDTHPSTKKLWEKVKQGDVGNRGIMTLYFANMDDELPRLDTLFDVHGSLTFSDHCREGATEERGICHISDDKPWWFGFDCGHSDDILPGMRAVMNKIKGLPSNYSEMFSGAEYRNWDYVVKEVESLAKQLKEVELG